MRKLILAALCNRGLYIIITRSIQQQYLYDLGLTEIVVMPTSNFAGLRIGEANLRKRFGINVLGVKRGDEY